LTRISSGTFAFNFDFGTDFGIADFGVADFGAADFGIAFFSDYRH
jgi:hypothetical protein